MEDFKIYSVSDRYISYLQEKFPNVYSNKMDTRVHTRKYLGVVLQVGEYKYYIPMSSPKHTDYQIAGDRMVIKKSIVPIMRVVVKNTKGKRELKATLRLSHMIPVPASELELYDLDNEPDAAYKDLVQNEIIFIRKNQDKISANAQLIYKQKAENDNSAKYVLSALDYKALEEMCDHFAEHISKTIV
ncbi:MAG: type III toxin-antitoxin system ToxN/AbiQ family toxin [Lachnospiraceae bacterium]|nr:type III toxin-antitoxin system ToxN/AbiQ family toxin [Lachnospiraceae bacterium]MBR3762132.1 type III toxin-antitoxin system ToxN/AbiQ family toxin [Lachnospiraceae bacterium]